MAQDRNIDHGYYAKIQTEGIAWSLRVNDLFVRENGDPGYVTSNGNIGLALLPGENLISLLFSPVTGEKTASGDFIFEMYDGVSIEIGIERLKFATRESFEITPIKLRYSPERNEFISEEKTTAGLDRALEQANMSSSGSFRISDLPPRSIVLRTGERIGGYRLDFKVDIDDSELRPFHWRKNAIKFADTPETRQELMQAYQNLHELISRGDKAAILREARPIWERSAFMPTSNTTTAEKFVERDDLGLTLFQQTYPDGQAKTAKQGSSSIAQSKKPRSGGASACPTSP